MKQLSFHIKIIKNIFENIKTQYEKISQIRQKRDWFYKTIQKNFGECEIYIFGSQTNLNKKGGDIDIYIILSKKINFKTKIYTKIKLQDELLRKVDTLISTNQNREIEIEAKKGIKL